MAHLARLRPHPVLAVTLAACGARAPRSRVAAGRDVPRIIHRGGQGGHRVHASRSITLSLAALGVVSLPSRWVSRPSPCRSFSPRSTTCFPSSQTGAGWRHSRSACCTASLCRSAPGPRPADRLARPFPGGIQHRRRAGPACHQSECFCRSPIACGGPGAIGGSCSQADRPAVAAVAAVWFAERAFDMQLFAALASVR